MGSISTFEKWVVDYGGRNKLARALGVSGPAVGYWLKRVSYPRVENMISIISLSRGQLTLNDMVRSCAPTGTRLPAWVSDGK